MGCSYFISFHLNVGVHTRRYYINASSGKTQWERPTTDVSPPKPTQGFRREICSSLSLLVCFSFAYRRQPRLPKLRLIALPASWSESRPKTNRRRYSGPLTRRPRSYLLIPSREYLLTEQEVIARARKTQPVSAGMADELAQLRSQVPSLPVCFPLGFAHDLHPRAGRCSGRKGRQICTVRRLSSPI